MDRVGSLRWRLRSLWFATLAGFGVHRPSHAWLRYSGYAVRVPGPFWRRWWHRFKPPPAPLPGRVPPGPPPWAGPPESELGVSVPLRTVLARHLGLVIALTDCVAYSNGFNFGIAIRSENELDHRSFGFGPPSEADRAGRFEVRVRFADGRESAVSGYGPEPTVMAYYLAWQEGREPEVPAGPIIGQFGGSGGGKRMDFQYWVWPLPPDGPLSISCEWLKGGMAASWSNVDGSAIREAGSKSASVWE
jgi:hypothetical protein